VSFYNTKFLLVAASCSDTVLMFAVGELLFVSSLLALRAASGSTSNFFLIFARNLV
jgi:hypothetical protein